MTLAHHDCQSKCDWHPTPDTHDSLPLFRCSGCQSEWTTAEAWTPRNVDGSIAAEVATARRLASGDPTG